MPALQHRSWCFTENNPGLYDPTALPYEYLCYSEEVGAKGTHHIQGFVWLKKKTTLAALKLLNPRASFRVARGTAEQNLHYVSKPVDGCECKHCVKARTEGGYRVSGPFEYGRKPAPGTKPKILVVREKIIAQVPEIELYEEDTFAEMVRYGNGLNKFRGLTIPPRNFKTEVAVLYGPTGTGKTRFIMENVPQDEVYWVARSRDKASPWFTGYDPIKHKHVVFDEYYGWVGWDMFLRMLDRSPLQVQVHGGMVQFRPLFIWITSNKHPREWYVKHIENTGAAYETLDRRFNVIRHYPRLGEFETIKCQFD